MATVTETQEQHFLVKGMPTFTFDGASADLRIAAGADDAVHVHITKKATALTEESAREMLARSEVNADQAEDDITVTVKERRGRGINWRALGISSRITVVVTAPAAMHQRLRLSSGDAEIVGISGSLVVDLNSGELVMRTAQVGAPAKLTLKSGNMQLRDITFAEMAQIGVNSGTLRLADVTFAHMAHLTVNSGNLDLDQVTFANETTLAVKSGHAQGAITFTERGSLNGAIQSGNARLTLPSETDAFVSATVLAGDVRVTGFPYERTQHSKVATATQAAHLLRFQVGAGSVRVTTR
jgi:hypothetical protein